MPKSRRIITLDLGSQSIGLGIFRVYADGTIELQDHRRRQILADPAGEAMRQPQMPVVLREMVGELQLKSADVNYSITGQSVFVRFVNLPQMDTQKIQRIITFEAQQNVPFPIDQIVWDYQVTHGGLNRQVEVMLVAIKADLLGAVNSAIEETGLKTCVVDVAPIARYNAFRYNYADLLGCSLLVNIGAHTTNFVFIERESFFSRTIPIGGGSITAAIAKEFGESFAAAEFRKQRCETLSLNQFGAEPADTAPARISKIARGAMTRLQTELKRSIGHYRDQELGNRPDRVFLGGGGASLPHACEFFCEKLQLPVEFFNPLRNVAVAKSAAVEQLSRSAHLLGELVGLALRTVSECPITLNLCPAVVTRRQAFERRRPFFVTAVAAIAFALLGWAFYYTRAAHAARAATQQIRMINAPMQAAEAKIERLRKKIMSLDIVAAPLTAAINDRFFWVEILEDLNARLPKQDIWITELVPTFGGKPVTPGETNAAATPPAPMPAIDGLLLRGLYLYNPRQQEVVVDYFRNLVGSTFFKVDPNNQARAIKSTIPNNDEWAFPYELQLDLRKPLKLL
jgi:type IV pilus assembly protein PilM